MSWAELSSVLSLGMGGWVKVEIKAISAQPTEVGVGLSWAELGKKVKMKVTPPKHTNKVSLFLLFLDDVFGLQLIQTFLKNCEGDPKKIKIIKMKVEHF